MIQSDNRVRQNQALLNNIQTFEAIFTLLGFSQPKMAAAYFVTYIETYPSSFMNIKTTSRELLGQVCTPNKLRIGRAELLERGFISAMITDRSGELYLPVNPSVIFKLNEELLLKTCFLEDELMSRSKSVENLSRVYQIRFWKDTYPIRSMTLLHSEPWLMYNLIDNATEHLELFMLTGNLSLLPQDLEAYNKMLKEDVRIKIIYRIADERTVQGFYILEREYEGRFESKQRDIVSTTSNSIVIDDKMAIDGREIPTGWLGGHSYVSTIYIGDKKSISDIKSYFNKIWASPPIAP
jgi:hypothetical protein